MRLHALACGCALAVSRLQAPWSRPVSPFPSWVRHGRCLEDLSSSVKWESQLPFPKARLALALVGRLLCRRGFRAAAAAWVPGCQASTASVLLAVRCIGTGLGLGLATERL